MSSAPEELNQEQWRKVIQEDDATVDSPWRGLQRRFGKMPRWTRYGAITLLLIGAIFTVYALIPSDTARLQIICEHNFRSAQLSIMVDGSVVYSNTLNGPAKKRLGILPKGQQHSDIFSKVVEVPTGKHVVQVHITAPNEGFDQARSAAGDFTSERESILQVNATRRTTLALNFDGATVVTASTATAAPDSHPIPKSGITIVFSILGTMLSASVSFLVQEFWRSHKNRISS